MKNFAQRFLELAGSRSPFCLGIDPTPQLLKAWELPDNAEGLARMCETIASAAQDRLAIVKPQIAFFERFGSKGIHVLEKLIESFHERGTLVLVDGKRGDIGSTVEAYAQAYLGPASAFRADAITAHAYLGFGALEPLLDRAVEVGAGVFVVVRSSNVEGIALQNAVLRNDGRTVADSLSDMITEFNEQTSGSEIGPIGAVVGATIENDLLSTLERLPRSLILAPGIGHQGATFDDLRKRFQTHAARAIPSSSRAVLDRGPDIEQLHAEISKQCEAARLTR
ncbi:MAG TPA: orotidine-5'-phosphate decarboxylase [Pyrinomonadaceae bacterium]|jgi:orotidine-5'-phosphate decarboxylase|nr:orotidine-5'-phosphate decarboxylase [Pyrinomonadaceae bacterium]